MDIGPHGLRATTNRPVITHNVIRGTFNGINLDLFGDAQ
jgi:hypothetical protein